MSQGKVPEGYVDKRRFDKIKKSIFDAELPPTLGGPEIILTSKRTTAFLIRQLFHNLGIVGVTVSCPNNHTYILIEMEEQTYRKDHHPQEVKDHFEIRQRLFNRLEHFIATAYPYLGGRPELIVYDVEGKNG